LAPFPLTGSSPHLSNLTAGEGPAQKQKRRLPFPRGRRWLLGGSVLAIVLAAWGVQRWLFAGPHASGEITGTVTRADLPITVTERGQLESAKTVTAKCQVEGESCKIAFIVPEGTRVKKGEVVVRFDADKIRRGVAEQEVKYQTADGKAKAATEELDVQKNKAESEIAKAQLTLTLAKLEREKYLDGEYKVDVESKKAAINLAEREFKEAEEKLEGFRTFVKKGFGTPEQLTQKELDVERTKNNLEEKKGLLMVLEKYIRPMKDTELTYKEKDAVRELARTQGTARANLAKADADHRTALAVAKLEKEQLERARKQLDHIAITAPQDGILVYEQTRYWDPSSRIQLGGMMYYQQPVFQLPDLEHMQVKVKIHESKVKKVRPSQKAEIRVEAFPGLMLHGTVEKVATLADSEGSWRSNGGAKEFETVITIDDLPTGLGLKPGFTAEVTILVNHLAGVLAAPIQAVAQRDGKHFAYLHNPEGVERREVTVGENNEKFVEVRAGLEEGAALYLDARARAAAETQSADASGRQASAQKK